MTALASAALAMNNAVTRYERASDKLLAATSRQTDDDAGAAIVDMIEAKTQFKAGALVARAADEMMGALFDIKI
jgi:flagellar hook protein FlgE